MSNANPVIDMTGGTTGMLKIKCGSTDYARFYGGQTGSNAGYLEIATADDYSEPIYARQYSGSFATLKRTLTLLDASGNTTIPNRLTVGEQLWQDNTNRFAAHFYNSLTSGNTGKGLYLGQSGSAGNCGSLWFSGSLPEKLP